MSTEAYALTSFSANMSNAALSPVATLLVASLKRLPLHKYQVGNSL